MDVEADVESEIELASRKDLTTLVERIRRELNRIGI